MLKLLKKSNCYYKTGVEDFNFYSEFSEGFRRENQNILTTSSVGLHRQDEDFSSIRGLMKNKKFMLDMAVEKWQIR